MGNWKMAVRMSRDAIYQPDAVGAGLGSNDATRREDLGVGIGEDLRGCEAGRGIGRARGSSSCATFLAAGTHICYEYTFFCSKL
jgi:hypothetical protein